MHWKAAAQDTQGQPHQAYGAKNQGYREESIAEPEA
jgi:hypothetical protein